MRTFVTGGAGFIGSNLVRLLVDHGHRVTVYDNLSTGYLENLAAIQNRVSFLEGDIRDKDLLEKSADGADVIFHLAASVGNKRSIEEPYQDAEINVLGTVNVLLAGVKHKVSKVVYSSSAGVYGEIRQIPISEEHILDPVSPYGASKLGAEKLCLAFHKVYDLDTVCLRYFNVYGINQRFDAYGNVIPIFTKRVLRSEPLTVYDDGEQTRDFVNVDDVAMANYQAAMTPGVNGVFNIGSGTSITVNNLVEIIYQIIGKPTQVIYAPPRLGDVRDSLADIRRASETFGFYPKVDIRTGIEEYLRWAETNMDLI